MRQNKEAAIKLLKDLGVEDYIINDQVKQGFSLNVGELKQIIVYDRHLMSSHTDFEQLGYGISNRTRENVPMRNGEFIINRRGTSRSFHGWDDEQKFHIDLCIHIPKKKFMVDVESGGNRVMLELFIDLDSLEKHLNLFLKSEGSESRLKMSDEIRHELVAELGQYLF